MGAVTPLLYYICLKALFLLTHNSALNRELCCQAISELKDEEERGARTNFS